MARPRTMKASEIIEANQDFIVSTLMGIDCERRSVAAVARALNVGKTTLENKLKSWRQQGVIPERARGLSESDKETVLQLYPEHTIRQIAKMYGVSTTPVRNALIRWGALEPWRGIDDLPVMGLAEFYSRGWRDVKGDTVLTVNRKPVLIVRAIGGDDG